MCCSFVTCDVLIPMCMVPGLKDPCGIMSVFVTQRRNFFFKEATKHLNLPEGWEMKGKVKESCDEFLILSLLKSMASLFLFSVTVMWSPFYVMMSFTTLWYAYICPVLSDHDLNDFLIQLRQVLVCLSQFFPSLITQKTTFLCYNHLFLAVESYALWLTSSTIPVHWYFSQFCIVLDLQGSLKISSRTKARKKSKDNRATMSAIFCLHCFMDSRVSHNVLVSKWSKCFTKECISGCVEQQSNFLVAGIC